MKIEIHKGLSIVLSTILLFIIFIGLPMVLEVSGFIYRSYGVHLEYSDLLISNLTMVIDNMDKLIIGFGLFSYAGKWNQDRVTWLLMGLVFGQFGLILFGLNIFTEKSSTHITKLLTPVLIMLTVSFFLNFTTPLLTVYLTSILSPTTHLIISESSAFHSPLIFGLMILLNIIFAIKLNSHLKQLVVPGKLMWVLTTVFLGLLPVILVQILIRKNNEVLQTGRPISGELESN